MPPGKIHDLPPPPTAQKKTRRSPFCRAFEHFQKVEFNGLLDVGCFKVADEKNVPKGRNVVGCRLVHTYKSNEHGNYLKTKSRVIAKEFTQVQDINYHKTTSPRPASVPVKGLSVFHLSVSRAFVQAPLEEEIYILSEPSSIHLRLLRLCPVYPTHP